MTPKIVRESYQNLVVKKLFSFFLITFDKICFNTHQTFFFLFPNHIKPLFHPLKHCHIYFVKSLSIKFFQNIIFQKINEFTDT